MNVHFTILCIASIAIALLALIISLVVYAHERTSQRERKDLRDLQIIREMEKRSRNLLEVFREHPDDRALQEAYKDASEDLAQAYENICQKYYEEETNREWFYAMYGRDLVSWVESGPLRDEFTRRRPRYSYTGRIYRELRRLYRNL